MTVLFVGAHIPTNVIFNCEVFEEDLTISAILTSFEYDVIETADRTFDDAFAFDLLTYHRLTSFPNPEIL